MSRARSALVTGASRGIGRGVALDFARRGYRLTITSRSDADLAALVPDLIDAGCPEVVHHAADMADTSGLPALVEHHRAAHETMDALIINAGVGTAGPVAGFPLPRLEKALRVNFTAAFVLIQSALPLLRAAAAGPGNRTGAKIVALGSITGVFAEAGLAAYGASKAAVHSLIETVNAEESGGGVSATAIAPAFVRTDMSAWATDRVPETAMIEVADVVEVISSVLRLSRQVCVPTIVMSRAGTTAYGA